MGTGAIPRSIRDRNRLGDSFGSSPSSSGSELRGLCDTIRPPSSALRRPTSVRLLLPLCQRSVISVTPPTPILRLLRVFAANPPPPPVRDGSSPVKKTYPIWCTRGRPRSIRGRDCPGDSFRPSIPFSAVAPRFLLLRLLRFFAANIPNLFTADHADSADKKAASVLSVPSCKIRPPSSVLSVFRLSAFQLSVFCSPSSAVRHPASPPRSAGNDRSSDRFALPPSIILGLGRRGSVPNRGAHGQPGRVRPHRFD
jgi:hypothetical protein